MPGTPIITRIAENRTHFAFETMFFKIKCEELLCHLFNQFLKKKEEPVSKFHIEDIKMIYRIKDHLHSNLAIVPNLAQVAMEAGMSETKLRKHLSHFSKVLKNILV